MIMKTIEINKQLQAVCEKLQWNVSVEESYPGEYRYEFETWSDAGQDVIQSITVSDPDDVDEILDALYQMWQDFDPEEETMLWIGPDGQGRHGAPGLRACLADMDSVEEMLEELHDEFQRECENAYATAQALKSDGFSINN